MSWHSNPNNAHQNSDEHHTNYVCINAIPKAMNHPDVTLETKEDPTLQCHHGHHMDRCCCQTFKKCEIDNLLWNHSTRQPSHSLWKEATDLTHLRYQGIIKTKHLREKVWFLNINKMVEVEIKTCQPCKVTTQETSPPPKNPWNKVAVNFIRHFPTSEYLLVIIDDYSRYPEVEICNPKIRHHIH